MRYKITISLFLSMSEFVVARFVANDVVDVSRALKEYEELRKFYDDQSSNDKLSNYNGVRDKMIKVDNILNIMAGDMTEDNPFRSMILSRPERRPPAMYIKVTFRVVDESRKKPEEKKEEEKVSDGEERPKKRQKVSSSSHNGSLVVLTQKSHDSNFSFVSNYRKFMEEYVTNHISIQCEVDEKLNDVFLTRYASEISEYKRCAGKGSTVYRMGLESFRNVLAMYQKIIQDLPLTFDKKALEKLEKQYEKAVKGRTWCSISSNDESNTSNQYIFNVKYLDKEYKVELPQIFPSPLYQLSTVWGESTSKLRFKIEKSEQVTYK